MQFTYQLINRGISSSFRDPLKMADETLLLFASSATPMFPSDANIYYKTEAVEFFFSKNLSSHFPFRN